MYYLSYFIKQMRPCPVPRRLSLSLDENLRAKEGGKEKTGETALNLPFSTLPMVPCASSPVTRVLRLPLCETMRKTKLLRRRLDETLITLGSKCYYRWDLYYIWVQLLNLCLLHRSLQFELKWYLWCINTDLFFSRSPVFGRFTTR